MYAEANFKPALCEADTVTANGVMDVKDTKSVIAVSQSFRLDIYLPEE